MKLISKGKWSGCIGALVVLVFLSGCTSTKLSKSGFLDDYSGLSESEVYKGMWVEHSLTKDIGDYSKFIVDPVIVYFKPRKGAAKYNPKKIGVNAEKLAELTSYFHDEMESALSDKGYKVVDRPGEGILRIRLAITDVDANLPILNVYGYQTVTGIGLGGASMEGEALDSVTHERIVAVVDRQKGKVFPGMKAPTDMAKEALKNKLDSLSKYKTIKAILKNWAEQFAARVEELHNI